MKRCPECGRDYDNSMMFCLDDGAELLYGPAKSEPGAAAAGFPSDEPQTAILHSTAAPGEAPTRAQIHMTDQTAILPRGAEAEPQSKIGGVAEKQSFSANRVAKPLVVVVVTFLIFVGGFFGYRYFKPAGSGQINSIAVLPFENRSGSADTDYLSDGIAESLIFRLSQLPDLKVSPVSSVIRYKGKEFDAKKIAGELGVGSVMSGRMTQRGDNLTISVELIDVANNKILWGEQYDRKLSDLLATQREIAATITQKLQLKLSGDEKGLTKKYTNSSEAYQLWLKGRFHFARRTEDDLKKSIEIFQQAVKLDPNFALGYVGIAESYSVIPSYPYASPAECIPPAKVAIAKALEIDPDLPEAHTVAGMIASAYEWDWAKAEADFKRSLELNPNLAITHYRYAWVYLSPLGRHDEAVAEMRKATELEPLSTIQNANFAAVLMYAGRIDEAVEQAKKTYDLDPTHIGSLNWIAHSLNAKGRYAESLEYSAQAERTGFKPYATKGVSFAFSGQRDKAMEIVKIWQEAESRRYIMNYWVAVTLGALGDRDGAFAELEKAYKNHDWFLMRLKTDPFAEPLRSDPRYKEMLKRLNLPE